VNPKTLGEIGSWGWEVGQLTTLSLPPSSTGYEQPVCRNMGVSNLLPHPQQSALTFLSQMPCLFQYHPFYFSVPEKKNHENRFKRKRSI
jgi:hypothetical protein